MTLRLVSLALVCTTSMTSISAVRADEFDLPPIVGTAAEHAAPAEAEGADDFDLPPVAGADAEQTRPAETESAEGFDLPPTVEAEAEQTAPPETESREARATRQSSLELELRGFRAERLGGDAYHGARASAHWFGRHRLGEDVGLLFNLRGRAFVIEDTSFSLDENLRLDVQELALSWTPYSGVTLQAGRVNIRNGVAHGFNPTDWFKADSLVVVDSQDPADRREERLGTVVMDSAVTVGSTLLQFGYRPEISDDPGSLVTDMDIVGLGLDRTNPSEAFYIKATPSLGGNLSLTGNLLIEDGRAGAGLELSGTVGDNLVLYGEAFVQNRRSLAAEALTGGLGNATFREAIGADDDYGWRTQLALGGTWSLPESLVGPRDISLSLEYHLNSAGLTNGQIEALADATGPDLAAAGLVHNYAANQQEPLAREQLFARFAWNDFWRDADFAALGYYVPADGSGLYQLSASIPLANSTELTLIGYSTFGDDTSVYGANPTQSTIQVALTHTF